MHYNEETLKKMYKSSNPLSESVKNQLDNFPKDVSSLRMQGGLVSSNTTVKDLEMPMPPAVLAPVQRYGIRYILASNVYDFLSLRKNENVAHLNISQFNPLPLLFRN